MEEKTTYKKVNEFMDDHLGAIMLTILIAFLGAIFVPIVIFSQDKYNKTVSEETLRCIIMDKTATQLTYDSMSYHIVVSLPETEERKAFTCEEALYTSVVVGDPLYIEKKVIYNTHYKENSVEYRANGTYLYG